MAIVTRCSSGWLALLLLALSGCSIAPVLSPADRVSDSGTIPQPERSASLQPSSAIESPTPAASRPTPSATPPDTENVRIYKLDTQCQWFQSEPIALPKERSIEAAVGKVLAAQQSSDFDLSGYRVLRRPNGEVIIDFRLAANSKRQMTSLSSCEQLALFGSLRQTLLRHKPWGVKLIRFTDRGRAIVL